MRQRPARRQTPVITPRSVIAYYGRLYLEGRRWLLFVVVAFLASSISGYIGATVNPSAHTDLIRAVGQGLQPALEALRQGNNLRAVLLIFWNNLGVLLLMMGTGALVLGVLVPVIVLGQNAYFLGVVVAIGQSDPARLLRSTLPHAIIELPAFFIATAWSFKMAVAWLLPGASGRRGDVWYSSVMEGLALLPLLIVMLAIAAIIEVLISARLGGVGG